MTAADRPLGALGGEGRIPWSSIVRYAEKYFPGDLEQEERLIRMLRAMDEVYLQIQAERMKQQQRQSKS